MMFKAATWNSGVTMATTSFSCIRLSTTTVCAVTALARWLATTPFGRPVVPPVYVMQKASSSPMSTAG
jgi:hypothetical protein